MEESLSPLDEDSPENIAGRLRELFREEAYELVAELESAVLEIEKAPGDLEQIGRVFRAMHTLKGSGAACGMDDVKSFTHEIETFFDFVRKGKIALTREIIDLTLVARDQIKAMLDACYHGGTADEAKRHEVIESFNKILARGDETLRDSSPHRAAAQPACSVRPVPEAEHSYRIRFNPSQAMVAGGTDPSHLINELRELGTCAVVAKMDALSSPTGAPCWEVLLLTRRGIDAVQDVFIFVQDQCDLKIDIMSEGSKGEGETAAAEKPAPAAAPGVQPVFGRGTAAGAKTAPAMPQQGQETPSGSHHAGALSTIRVATDKLDALADLVGELVTIQTRLSQTALSRGIPEFLSIAEEMERLTSNLREEAMSIRMMPIGATFSRFKRLVRDLAQELEKEIELVTEGGDTELDKTILERLGDPLVHLIRNSIDHGIESPEARVLSGKPAGGRVVLSAMQEGAHVLIQITDDGAGFDLKAIRAKGIERGLIREGVLLSDRELLSMIFMPGFSTAKTVTNVSGRGVGLDVVKRAVASLGGTIHLRNNGESGTTIVLKMPLTLAIIDGLLIKVGGERYVFPLSFVEEIVEQRSSSVRSGGGRRLLDVRGELVPYIPLREQFSITGATPEIVQIVIARIDDRRIGFVVDLVVGDHQTVIKNIGGLYRDVEGISGATILGDGAVALILDVPKLIQIADREETALCNGAMSTAREYDGSGFIEEGGQPFS